MQDKDVRRDGQATKLAAPRLHDCVPELPASTRTTSAQGEDPVACLLLLRARSRASSNAWNRTNRASRQATGSRPPDLLLTAEHYSDDAPDPSQAPSILPRGKASHGQ